MTLQEYFEKLGKDSVKWGKPFSALLGAFYTQKQLGIPAIGGKDSMSGTFKDLDVPPTLVAFAVTAVDVRNVVSQEFKQAGSQVVLVRAVRDETHLPDFAALTGAYDKINELVQAHKVLAAYTVKLGGIAEAVSKMAFGNRIGVEFTVETAPATLFAPDYGSVVLELPAGLNVDQAFGGVEYEVIGRTTANPVISVNGVAISIEEAFAAWERPLEKVFPTRPDLITGQPQNFALYTGKSSRRPVAGIAKPRPLFRCSRYQLRI